MKRCWMPDAKVCNSICMAYGEYNDVPLCSLLRAIVRISKNIG